MSTKTMPPLADLDRLARNPNLSIGIMVGIRCVMLDNLSNSIAGSGRLDCPEIRIAEHCLSALYPYRDDKTIEQTEKHFFKVFLNDITQDYLHGHFGNGVSIFRSKRYPSGVSFDNFLHSWQGSVIENYLSDPYVYLSPLRHYLLIDFGENLDQLMSTTEYQSSHAARLKRDEITINRLIHHHQPLSA